MVKFTYDASEGRDIHYVLPSVPLYGIERAMGIDDTLPNEGPLVAFRVYDDDDELMARGVLLNDDECENQSAALRFAESNWGCTRIKVKLGDAWVQEIA